MTYEELLKIPFHFQSHISLENKYSTVYTSEDGRLGYCDHVPYRHGEPHGKAVRHYRIEDTVYKTKESFLKALENFN